MAIKSFGKFEALEPRNYWNDEAKDFTPWLAKEENIAMVGDVLGLELEVQSTEESVGPFRADILCKETASGRYVLIENQLEKTDHDHLGKLITYAAGLEAVVIVWISRSFTEEHRSAIDWLNRVTDESANFFGLEIEIWRIGNSDPAPKLNVVCMPNEWRKSVNPQPRLSESQRFQLEYWTAYIEHLKANNYKRVPKPQPQNWLYHSLGRGGFGLSSVASQWDSIKKINSPVIRMDFFIDGEDSKKYFFMLEGKKQEIEESIGEELFWYNPENARVCKIFAQKSVNIKDKKDWKKQHEWLYDHLKIFESVFTPLVKNLYLPVEMES